MALNKVEILKNLFLQDDFVSKFHLQSTDEIGSYQDLLGHHYTLEFCNSKRKFELTLCIVEEDDELGDIINMAIHKLEDLAIDEEPYFTILDWMRIEGKAYSEKSLFLRFHEGGGSRKNKIIPYFLNHLFENTSLEKILGGEEWKDYPFNWMGMK